MLTEGLRQANLQEIHEAAGRMANAMEDRDDAIRDAYRDEVPVSEIAAEAGITRQRVWQIVNTR